MLENDLYSTGLLIPARQAISSMLAARYPHAANNPAAAAMIERRRACLARITFSSTAVTSSIRTVYRRPAVPVTHGRIRPAPSPGDRTAATLHPGYRDDPVSAA
ncbi:hypothetical protein GCM10027262_02750 [Nocardia tengchongensis]